MRENKLCFKIFLLLLVFSLLIVGCTPARRPMVERTPNTMPNTNVRTPNTTPNTTTDYTTRRTVPETDRTAPNNMMTPTTDMGNTVNRDVETRIIREVEKISGVKNVAVLVNDKTAYIGVDLGMNVSDTKEETIRSEVIKKVKDMEPTINKVYVSANPDVVGRLTGYGRDIRSGRPITGLINQIEQLFTRPIPRS